MNSGSARPGLTKVSNLLGGFAIDVAMKGNFNRPVLNRLEPRCFNINGDEVAENGRPPRFPPG